MIEMIFHHVHKIELLVLFPKNYLILTNFHSRKQYANKIEYSNCEKYIVLDFFDTDNNFSWVDICDIKKSYKGPLYYFLELSSFTNDEMTIFFDY
jgi:hypothetical protein